MSEKFRYRFDRRSRRITTATLLFFVLVVGIVWFFVDHTGHYLSAWTISLLAAVLMLYILSIPRTLYLDDEALEIRCVLDVTHIDLNDVRAIRRLPRHEFRRCFPLLGSYGFFGYYGFYLDLSRWETFKIYAGDRNALIEITDIFEQRYVVSAVDPERVVTAVEIRLETLAARKRRPSHQ